MLDERNRLVVWRLHNYAEQFGSTNKEFSASDSSGQLKSSDDSLALNCLSFGAELRLIPDLLLQNETDLVIEI